MKKIVLSVAMIAAVAAIAIGATTAYFSDTETSTGNTFTAGAIDLTVSSEGTATNGSCTFEQTTGNPFFYCTDVKPGDSGESTIHFKLDSNPAWACATISNLIDSDNGCNEPESVAEPNCTEAGNGELDQHLNLTVWVDNGAGAGGVSCDNNRNGTEEMVVENAPLSQFLAQTPTGQSSFILPISDNSGGSMMNEPLQPGEHCLGIEWNVPSETGNDVQTDTLGGDLEFYVEQARNNANFTCDLQN